MVVGKQAMRTVQLCIQVRKSSLLFTCFHMNILVVQLLKNYLALAKVMATLFSNSKMYKTFWAIVIAYTVYKQQHTQRKVET